MKLRCALSSINGFVVDLLMPPRRPPLALTLALGIVLSIIFSYSPFCSASPPILFDETEYTFVVLSGSPFISFPSLSPIPIECEFMEGYNMDSLWYLRMLYFCGAKAPWSIPFDSFRSFRSSNIFVDDNACLCFFSINERSFDCELDRIVSYRNKSAGDILLSCAVQMCYLVAFPSSINLQIPMLVAVAARPLRGSRVPWRR